MKRDIMIAIDPGNEQTGWVVYDVSEKVLIYKNKEVNSDMFKKVEEILFRKQCCKGRYRISKLIWNAGRTNTI